MAVETLKKIDEELECCVCHDEYNDPRTLPCAHHFCLECIQDCRKFNGYIVCPLCRKSHRANPLELPKAINIGVLLELRQSALNEQMMPNEIEKEMCPAHPDEELKVLCVPCQEVVCFECLAVKHAGHAHQKVTELHDKKKEEIDLKLSQLQVNIDQLETVSDQLQTMEETVKLNGGSLKQEIDTRAEDLMTKMTSRRIELKKMVDKEVEGKVMAIRQQRDTVRQHINEIMTAREKINNKLEEWDKVKMAANSQQLLVMATDTQTTGLVKEAGKASPELEIVLKSAQLNGDETMLGQIIKKPRKNNVIEMWQLCKKHIRSPELSKHLMNSVVLAIAVLIYYFSPLLGLIVMALITLHATLEYNSIDNSIRIDRHQVWCNDMEATLPESLKVFAIVIGAFIGVPLFYLDPWLYSIVCIVSLIAGLYKAINSIQCMGLVDKSEWFKKLFACSGAVIVVLLYYYQPLLGLGLFVLGASIYINSGSFDVKVLSIFWVEFAMTITLSFILLQSATLKIIGHIVQKSGKSNVIKMLQVCKRYILTPNLSRFLILLAMIVIAVLLYHFSPLLGLIVMALITLYASLEYNHTDKSMRVNGRFKDDFPETMSEWLKVFAVVTGTIAGIPLFYSFPWLYSIACIIGLLIGLYKATDDFIAQYGPIDIHVPPNLSKSLKVFMSVIGTTVMVVLHIYHPWFGLCGIVLVILISVTTIGIIHRSVASIETFSEIITSIPFITVVFGLLLSQHSSVRITVTIFNWIPFFHTKKL